MKRMIWAVIGCLAAIAWVQAPAGAHAPAAQAIPGWEEVTPGPWAVCSDGSPFKFYHPAAQCSHHSALALGGG